MSDPDLNTLRRIIGEQQGRMPRKPRRPRRSRLHRPRIESVGDILRILLSAFLTVTAAIATFTVGHLAMFWTGDHAASHNREWGPLRALGFRVEKLPGVYYLDHAITAELRLLVWFVVLAVVAALTYRPAAVTLLALLGGLVPQAWWTHVPTAATPHWVVELVAKQVTWFPHASPWLVWAVAALVAGTATAWATRAQAI